MSNEIEHGPERTIQRDLPATPDVETREETIARVMGEVEAASVGFGGSADPSTRRGVPRLLARRVMVAAAAGAAVGAAVGLALSFLPGPREEGRGLGAEGSGWPHVVGYALVMAIGLAVIVAVIVALWTLAREDGRIEREVEEKTGRGPEGPGSPNSPDQDLELH